MTKNGIVGLLLASLLAAVAPAWADEPVGSIEDLAGAATAQDAAGASRDLAPGSPVHLGDKIVTASGARLTIRFTDNSTVGQGENAELVINKYVFDPAAKDNNQAAFRAIRGVFRFITDQITKLNPEHYEVESNYGTIGIRGCELGFDIGPARDDVFVIGLTGRENILIRLHEDLAKQHPGGLAELLIGKAGIAVGLSPLDGLTQRHFDPDDLGRLIHLTTPSLLEPKDQGGEESPPSDSSGKNPPPDVVVQEQPDIPVTQVDTVVADSSLDQQQQQGEPPLTTDDGQPVDSSGSESGDAGGTGGGDGQQGDGSQPGEPAPHDGNGGGGGNEPPPRPTFETVGPPFKAAEGSGQDWSWGIWGQEYVKTDADGTETKSTRYKLSTTARDVDPAAYDAIANNANIRYNLQGSGPAGASVTMGAQSSVIEGSASFQVVVGGGQPGTWNGSFNLDNAAGDTLAFTLNGSIQQGGGVDNPSPSSYALHAFGQDYGTPASSDVGGGLVGPGTTANPISGILVHFGFDHGSGGPQVVGAGGADLH